jgi:hypothetical protein
MTLSGQAIANAERFSADRERAPALVADGAPTPAHINSLTCKPDFQIVRWRGAPSTRTNTKGDCNVVNWLHELSYIFGGLFLANAIPHYVSGVMGRPFQSPFARPPGQGLSSSTVNVIWGVANFIAAYLLIVRVGRFDLHDAPSMLALGLGALLISLVSAKSFGRFHGGDLQG